MPSRDSGLTLIELMVAMSLFLVAMVMFGTSLYVVQRMQISNGDYSRANDQANLALQAIDRQVRSGYVIKVPSAPPKTDAAVKIYTEAGGKIRCVMWVVADPAVADPRVAAGTKWLYTTAWDPTGKDHSVPSTVPTFDAKGKNWITAATDLWNWIADPSGPVQPFTVTSLDETDSTLLSSLKVSFVLNASTRDGAAIEIGSWFTSRNVQRGTEAFGSETKASAC